MPFWTPSQQCQNRLYRIVSVVRFFDCVNYVTMPVVSVGLRLVLQLTWLTFALSWVALVNICKWFGCRFGMCRYIWKPCDHTQYVTKLQLGISLSAMSPLVENVHVDFGALILLNLMSEAPSVLQHCWLGDRKGIKSVKSCALGWWWW